VSRRGRRGNAEGSVYQRRDGRWVAQLQIGYGANGAPRFRHRYAATRREADDRLVEMKAARLNGVLGDDEGLTVAGLLERWLESKTRDLRPSTLLSYRSTARLYITPMIGRLRLERLRPLDLERMVAALLEAGHSPHIAAYSLRIIKSALKQAVRWQLVGRNAAEAIRPPRVPRNELTVWTGAEAKRFLEASAPHRLHALFVLALLTGMRRGELLGLGWDDLDLERARLTVRRNLVYTPGLLELSKPKTSGSHRTVPLSSGVIEVLREHRIRQTLERKALGTAYGNCELVFASEVGTPTHPRNLERVFFNLLEASGVRRIRFHDLRHTAASLMILRNVLPKVVSRLLGHASVAFTLQVYVHVFEEQETGATLDLSDLA
jgi:integrase